MKLTVALILSAVIAPLVASAPTTFDVGSLFAISEETAESQLVHSPTLSNVLRRHENTGEGESEVYRKQSSELSDLNAEMRGFFDKEYFDFDKFDKLKYQWVSKIFQIDNAVKGDFVGKQKLERRMQFLKLQFRRIEKTSIIRGRFQKDPRQYVGSDDMIELLTVRARLGSLYVWDDEIASLPDIDARIGHLETNYKSVNAFINSAKGMLKEFRTFCDEQSVDVVKVLKDLKERVAKNKSNKDLVEKAPNKEINKLKKESVNVNPVQDLNKDAPKLLPNNNKECGR